jgi:hypothetical protein
VRDSQDPASFFQDVLVASERTAMLVALAAFLSASLPMKPIRVIRLRYIGFSKVSPCSTRLSRAQESEWARLPRQEAAFLGGPERGSQNRKGARAKQKLRSRRAPQRPRTIAETNGQDQGTRPNRSPRSAGRSRRLGRLYRTLSFRPGSLVLFAD